MRFSFYFSSESIKKEPFNLWLENKFREEFFLLRHDTRVNGKIFPENEKLRIRNACKNKNRPSRQVSKCVFVLMKQKKSVEFMCTSGIFVVP